MTKTQRTVCCLMLVATAACKPDIPPTPVPFTKAVTGVEAPCESLVFAGFPQKDPPVAGTFFVCRPGYALNYDPTRKTAQWVVERLRSSDLAKSSAFRNIDDSRPDPQLSEAAQSQNNDYVGTGYQRVQLAPALDFQYDDVLYSHTFYLSNAVPLHPDRVATWKGLEEMARKAALQRGEIFVVSGTVYEEELGLGWVGTPHKKRNASVKTANVGKIEVPTHLFKALIDPKRHEGIVLLLPNKPASKDVPPLYVLNMKDLQALSKVNILPNLAPVAEQQMKEKASLSAWN